MLITNDSAIELFVNANFSFKSEMTKVLRYLRIVKNQTIIDQIGWFLEYEP